MVFGMCADKYESNLNNYFISITDVATGNIIFKKIAPLPSNLIDDIAIDRQASVRESSYGLYNDFKLRDVLIRANGSVDYLFEFYQDVDHFGNVDDADARRSLQKTDCLCGDIIDINITNTGKAIFTRIPKLQAAVDFSLASGFIATTYNNKLLLLYNDDADNLTKDLSRKPDVCSKFGKSSFTMAVIDEKGSLTRQTVFSNQGMPVTCCTCKCSKGLNNKIVIYAQKIDALSASADMVGSIDIK